MERKNAKILMFSAVFVKKYFVFNITEKKIFWFRVREKKNNIFCHPCQQAKKKKMCLIKKNVKKKICV